MSSFKRWNTCDKQSLGTASSSLLCIIFGHLWILGYNKHPHNSNNKIMFHLTVNVPHTEHSLAFSSNTRSILFFPRGLMSLRINAVMMSMPLDSWVAMQFCPKKSHQTSLIACTTNTARAGDPTRAAESPLSSPRGLPEMDNCTPGSATTKD